VDQVNCQALMGSLVGAVFLWCLFIGWLFAGGGSNKGCAGICSTLGRLDVKFWFLV
jgi:hypothetical protein